MEFSVRHFISGRIRLHLPSLCRKRKLAEAALAWLQTQQGIKGARLNFVCGSLIIEYDPSYEGVLRATLGRLSLDESRRASGAGRSRQRRSCPPDCSDTAVRPPADRSGAAARSRFRPYRC